MDMYFSTLKMVSGMMLIAGLLNIHNILYYASSDYSPNGQDNISSIFLKGSALCTTSEWVVCRDCVVDDYELEARSRIGVAQDDSVLVQHNDCNGADMVQGTVNFATFFFLLGSMAFMSIYLGIREVRSDEDKYVLIKCYQIKQGFALSSVDFLFCPDAQRLIIPWWYRIHHQRRLIQTNGKTFSRNNLALLLVLQLL